MKILGGLSSTIIGGLKLQIVSGLIYSRQQLFRGFIQFNSERIIALEEGAPPEKPVAEGLILPLLTNCHTHVGDFCLRGRIDHNLSLDDVVRPPDGVKYRLASQCSEGEICNGIRAAADEMENNGVAQFIDFREGGLQGVNQLSDSMEKDLLSRSIILSRPASLEYSESEVDSLLSVSQGIGISSISDWKYYDLSDLANHAHGSNKIFALHASEGKRENIEDILALNPDFLVHMTNSSNEDLKICAEKEVPIVVCPRSNLIFKLKLDIARMIDAGVCLCMGSDNAMLNNLSILDEMRAAYSNKNNSRQLTPLEILKLAIDNPRKVLKEKTIIGIEPGAPCEFMVVRSGKSDSPQEILDEKNRYTIDLINRRK